MTVKIENVVAQFIGQKKYLINQVSVFILIALFLFVLFTNNAFAGTGTTGFNFLRVSPSARYAGMADASVAISDDSSSTYWNPAGLSYVKGVELGFTHLIYLEGISYEYLAFASKLGRKSTFGFNAVYLNSGKMDILEEDATGSSFTKTGTFNFNDIMLNLAFARKILEDNSFTLSIGIGAKAVMEQTEGYSLFGSAVDVGVIYERPKYKIGLVIQNLGPNTGEKMPLTIKGGFGADVSFLNNPLVIGIDIEYPLDVGKFKINAGLEYWLLNMIAARVGYKANSDLEQFSFGTGFKIGGKTTTTIFNYAFIPMLEGFGITHRVSLIVKFY